MAKANQKFRLRDDREGVVGVGTLIVFVATILVAAIASGVIIKTAYSLKDQAERTGLAARNEITGGLKVIDIIGDKTGNGGGNTCAGCIRYIIFTLTTWKGSNGVDFAKMKVHWTGKTVNTYLDQNTVNALSYYTPTAIYFGASTADDIFTVGEFDPATVPPTYYVGDDLVMKLKIDTGNPGIAENGIAPGTAVTVDFIPASGPATEEQFITPNDYGTATFIDLTNT